MNQPIAHVFQHCPRCGESTSASGNNPFRCLSCGFTFYFSPVTAVGAVIEDSQGKVLLIKRAQDPGRGKFSLPGGFVDAGERLEDALRREVSEETNLQLDAICYLTSYPNTYAFRGTQIPVTDAFFSCTVASFSSITAQEGEIDGFHFSGLSASDLDQMAFDSNRKALELYQQSKS